MSSIRARLSRTTPLGRPVVPPVYIRMAGSVSSGSGGTIGLAGGDDVLVGEVVGDVAAADQDQLVDAGLGAHRVDHGGEEGVGEADLGRRSP